MNDAGIETELDSLYGEVEEFLVGCAAEQVRSSSDICKLIYRAPD